MEIKEKLFGKIIVDEAGRTVTAKKEIFSFDEVLDIACCSRGLVRFANNDNYKKDKYALVGIRLNKRIKQAGGMLNVVKTDSVIFMIEDALQAESLCSLIAKDKGIDPSAHWDNATFPFRHVIVEAKRKCNDYTRAGTAGSRPYRKPGLAMSIIMPEYDFKNGAVTVKYVGTNDIAGGESEWFTAHPRDVFRFAGSDYEEPMISVNNGTYAASADYRIYAIERDENAKGLWQLIISKSFDDACSAVRWLRFLQDSEDGLYEDNNGLSESKEIISENITSEPIDNSKNTTKRTDLEKQMLKMSLDTLLAAGILNQSEYDEKIKMI